MTKRFKDLTPSESKGLDKIIFHNSIKLKRDAECIVLHRKSYSTGTSLMVLSLEEIIKALVVYIHSEGYPIYKSKKILKIFILHKTRHEFASMIDTIDGVSKLMLLFNKVIEHNKNNPEQIKKRHKNSKEIIEVFGRFCDLLNSLFNDETIDNFNDYKNGGLYVDYFDGVTIPKEEITEGHYYQVQNTLNNIKRIYKLVKMAHAIPEENSKIAIDYKGIKEIINQFTNSNEIDDF